MDLVPKGLITWKFRGFFFWLGIAADVRKQLCVVSRWATMSTCIWVFFLEWWEIYIHLFMDKWNALLWNWGFFFKYSINEKVYYWKLQNLIPADFIATPVRVIKVITKNEAMSRQITANCSEGKRNIWQILRFYFCSNYRWIKNTTSLLCTPNCCTVNFSRIKFTWVEHIFNTFCCSKLMRRLRGEEHR